MWRPSNLPDHPPPNPTTLFAAQAWHELLSPQSPDTFQARALDLPTLLEEVTEVANLSSEDERWRAHLPMVADELHECRQTDSPLLVYRLYRAWRELHDPNSLARSMVSSRCRIAWQIARIYRARNLPCRLASSASPSVHPLGGSCILAPAQLLIVLVLTGVGLLRNVRSGTSSALSDRGISSTSGAHP